MLGVPKPICVWVAMTFDAIDELYASKAVNKTPVVGLVRSWCGRLADALIQSLGAGDRLPCYMAPTLFRLVNHDLVTTQTTSNVDLYGNKFLTVLIRTWQVWNRIINERVFQGQWRRYQTMPFPDQLQVFAAITRLTRQVLGFYSRLTVDFSEELVANSFAKMKERLSAPETQDLNVSRLATLGRVVFSDFNLNWLTDDRHSDSLPRVPRLSDGPGQVSEHFRRSEKFHRFLGWDRDYDWKAQWIDRPLFGVAEQDEVHTSVSLEDSSIARLVPKDFRGPRGIAMEPCLHQYVQMGIKNYLYEFFPRSLLKQVIHIDDQSVNRNAALQASKDGSLATIDLSDASDTVRCVHIRAIFRDRPDILSVLEAARTRFVRFPTEKVEITSFTPMGSAMCFPLETVVYTLLAIDAMWDRVYVDRYVNISPAAVRELVRKTHLLAYGDDVIVRSEYVDAVVSAFIRAGMLPNLSKCCTKGFFRESCGCDALYGVDVTPLRPRTLPGAVKSSWNGWLDIGQDLADRGYWRTLNCVLSAMVAKYHRPVPLTLNLHAPHCIAVSPSVLSHLRPAIHFGKVWHARYRSRGIQEPSAAIPVFQAYKDEQVPCVIARIREALARELPDYSPFFTHDQMPEPASPRGKVRWRVLAIPGISSWNLLLYDQTNRCFSYDNFLKSRRVKKQRLSKSRSRDQ